MVGLLMKNDNAMQQWYQLFESRSNMRSLQANQHWHHLMRLGLPSHKHEHWKYTSLDALLSQQFVLPQAQELSDIEVSEYALPLNAIRLVFVNGRFKSELSAQDTEMFVIQHSYAADRCLLPEPVQSEVFLHLTESLAEEVTSIRLPRGRTAPRPLYLLHITSGQVDALNTVHNRHHFELEENSKAAVIEHYVTLNATSHFTGARFTFSVADNACLNHVKLMFEESSSYHFAHNDIVIGCDANVNSTNFLLSACLVRQNISVQLNGENTQLSLKSLVLPMNAEVADTRSYIEHNTGYCLSRQLHKTISRDKGRSVFNGHIKVAQYALKTDSQMINNNLLLGHLAEVDTKPQLEIYADDVKCSHGATVGHIDDEQIFYLRSRGITEYEAQQMIIHAFSAELTETLEDNTLRKVVIQSITARFLGVES